MIAPSASLGSRRQASVPFSSREAEAGHLSQSVVVQHCYLRPDDVVVDLLKRHSGIVWEAGRFRGIAPRRGREEIKEPCGYTQPQPHALSMPGAAQLTVKPPWAEAPPDTVLHPMPLTLWLNGRVPLSRAG